MATSHSSGSGGCKRICEKISDRQTIAVIASLLIIAVSAAVVYSVVRDLLPPTPPTPEVARREAAKAGAAMRKAYELSRQTNGAAASTPAQTATAGAER